MVHIMKESLPDDSESIVHIDEHRLDRECVRLPSQYRQAAWQAAELNRDVDELKAQLEVVEAEFNLKVRQDPSKFGLEKLTEAALKELGILHPEMRKIEEKIRRAAHKEKLMAALCRALDMKKRSLTNLVELHSAGYHAEVRPSESGRDALRKISRSRIAPPMPRDKLMKKDRSED